MSKKYTKEVFCTCRVCKKDFSNHCITPYCQSCENIIKYADGALEDGLFESAVVAALLRKFVDKYELGYVLYQIVERYVQDEIDRKTQTDYYP